MTSELASTYTAIMIETLLNVHALANMHRASDNEGYRRTAADWLPVLEQQLSHLRQELTTTKDKPND